MVPLTWNESDVPQQWELHTNEISHWAPPTYPCTYMDLIPKNKFRKMRGTIIMPETAHNKLEKGPENQK